MVDPIQINVDRTNCTKKQKRLDFITVVVFHTQSNLDNANIYTAAKNVKGLHFVTANFENENKNCKCFIEQKKRSGCKKDAMINFEVTMLKVFQYCGFPVFQFISQDVIKFGENMCL